MAKILIVDNDDSLIHFLSRVFVRQGHAVDSCHDGQTALARLAAESFDAIFLDYKMSGLDGLETLKQIRRSRTRTPVIIMTAHGTTETAIEAMRLGAYDYVLKPFDSQELRRITADAVEVNRLMKEVVSLSGSHSRVFPVEQGATRIVGSHRKMQEVFKLIGQVAEKDVTVLITGESGTGKELVARAIYHYSRRRDKPFMAVNCASIPDTLFESELFGHERGAFTGADRCYLGKFERCHEGTLFFDEIADMSLSTQAKVLRVLQGGDFERLGGSELIRVSVRVLAATNKDLEQEVATGRFREDLYYRLKIISVHLPPLRERLADIPDLVHYFVARLAAEYSKPVSYVADRTLAKLRSYHWPGNVRELENGLRRAVLMCQGDLLLPEHIHCASPRDSTQGSRGDALWERTLRERIETLIPEILRMSGQRAHANLIDLVEETLIAGALRECNQNQVHTARMLGISRNTLRHRIKKYGLELPSDKEEGRN